MKYCVKEGNLGISDDRLQHIIGVARKCYLISLDMGFDENFARKMFIIGYLHDIGYEFSKVQSEHSVVSAGLLGLLGNIDEEVLKAIKYHGRYLDEGNVYWYILNKADMLIGPTGKEIKVSERLEDIKVRYGEYSDQYLTACDICYKIGLTAVNISGNVIV